MNVPGIRYNNNKPFQGLRPVWTKNPAGIPVPDAAYVMNERGGGIFDSSGKKGSGVWSATGSHWVVGEHGWATTFNGDYIAVDAIKALNVGNHFTVYIRFNPTSWGGASDDKCVFMQADGVNAMAFGSRDQANISAAVYYSGGWQSVKSASTPSVGTWHSAFITYNGTIRLWLDFVEASGGVNPVASLNVGTLIGDRTATGKTYNGLVGLLYVYPGALTFEQYRYIDLHPYYAWEHPEPWQYYVPAPPGGLSIPIARRRGR